ncbi:MAG: phosphoglucomutase (alpha-D-glucose-1,6-bisphosphate-dependent) [Betaproteobacteria bacterium]|jgi:phosphoglucomutase|nr:phosphoglucomutase (alpha-D-glucose-1,6-bisphosphate-dependent) [Betaproteobacteria bacterium]
MSIHPRAGKPASPDDLIDVPALERAFYDRLPDPRDPAQRVAFGTSGHRGSALTASFNAAHIHAIAQAICEYRHGQGIDGPLFLGKDTHALSRPAEQAALEVFAGNGVQVRIQEEDGFTPTPVVSHAIVAANRGRTTGLADGVVVTPSHNPPADGGIKYNPPHGGPADTDATGWIERRANALLADTNRSVRRLTTRQAFVAPTTVEHDFVAPYVADLENVIDMEAIRRGGLKLGVDPLGGAAVGYWRPIAERYGLDLEVVNPDVDPTFRFMTLDHDGKIRMDCSSRYAMASLVALKNRFAVAWGNDTDADRHGIVTPKAGLLNSNHYLAVSIDYLLSHRPGWSRTAGVGKTLVSSSLIDRVVAARGFRLAEMPVGFKWFAKGLADASLCFAGEESAGASFLRRDGTAWATDKDGIILGLLSAEITAVTGADPGEYYRALVEKHGAPFTTRIDAPATLEQKNRLKNLSPRDVQAETLAGQPIVARMTRAPANDAEIGGLKVVTREGWFAARPSGTEDIYKLYAESFVSEAHLDAIVREAQAIVSAALA